MIPNTDREQGRPREWLAFLMLSFTALCWGANAVFGRLAVGEISPMLLVTLRWCGVLTILSFFAIKHVRRDWPVLKKNFRFLFLMGALGFTGFNALFYVAAYTTSALNIGILQGAIPVFVLLGAFVAYRTPISTNQTIGVVITIVGVALVATGGELSRLTGNAINLGDGLMIVACVLYAGYAVGLQKRPPVSALSVFSILAIAALVTSVPLVVIETALGNLLWPTPKGWMIVALIALFPSLIAQLFFMKGVTMIGPGRAGIFVNLVPIFASILAVFILRESFQLYHALALLLVLSGIWLSERGRKMP